MWKVDRMDKEFWDNSITCEACGNSKHPSPNGLMPWHVDIVQARRNVFAWCHNYDPVTQPMFIGGE